MQLRTKKNESARTRREGGPDRPDRPDRLDRLDRFDQLIGLTGLTEAGRKEQEPSGS
jgi:hypothetical protein